MDVDVFGEIVLTAHSPTVERAPARSLISLELLRQMASAYVAGRDRLLVGHFPDGRPCWYRVTGWSGEHKALIVELDQESSGRVRADAAGRSS